MTNSNNNNKDAVEQSLDDMGAGIEAMLQLLVPEGGEASADSPGLQDAPAVLDTNVVGAPVEPSLGGTEIPEHALVGPPGGLESLGPYLVEVHNAFVEQSRRVGSSLREMERMFSLAVATMGSAGVRYQTYDMARGLIDVANGATPSQLFPNKHHLADDLYDLADSMRAAGKGSVMSGIAFARALNDALEGQMNLLTPSLLALEVFYNYAVREGFITRGLTY